MKKLRNILAISVFCLSIGACGAADGIGETCNTSNNGCDDFQACCTATKCRYKYDGQVFPCNGTDCGAAAADLVDYMCNF